MPTLRGTAIFLTSMALMLLAGCDSYVEPPDTFLQSKIATPLGMNDFPFGEYSVRRFTEIIAGKTNSHGEKMKMKGWRRNENVYTLEYDNIPIRLIFTHTPGKEEDPKGYCSMEAITDKGTRFTGYEFMGIVLNMWD